MTETVGTTDIEARILAAINELGGPDPATLSPTTTFEEIDLDSLDLVEMGQMMEEELGISLDTSDISELKTIADAVELMRRHAS
jgi:acyl carrier protein